MALTDGSSAALEPVDLNDTAREVLALCRGELKSQQVIVRLELPVDIPLVYGDRVQLQQVILNLLLNAAEAMSGVAGRPRELMLRTLRQAGDAVCLSVMDTGDGFPPDQMEHQGTADTIVQ